MSSRRSTSPLALFSLIIFAILVALLAQSASAAPTPIPSPEPDTLTPGEVIAKNRDMACTGGTCFYKTNGTEGGNTTDPAAASGSANSTESGSPTAVAPVSNSAAAHYDTRIIWPAVMAGTSLLFVL